MPNRVHTVRALRIGYIGDTDTQPVGGRRVDELADRLSHGFPLGFAGVDIDLRQHRARQIEQQQQVQLRALGFVSVALTLAANWCDAPDEVGTGTDKITSSLVGVAPLVAVVV